MLDIMLYRFNYIIMDEMNYILVPYDNSPEAEKALQHSFSIADTEDEILILMVLNLPETSFFLEPTEDMSIKTAYEHLETVKSRFVETGLKINLRVVRGNVVDEIIKASDESDCKLIVLGYKGISKIGKFILGSVSGEVAKHAKKPVLIVK